MQKKQISMLTAAACVVGCAGLMAMPAVAAPASNADYTVTDLVNLQRSLLICQPANLWRTSPMIAIKMAFGMFGTCA